MYLNEIPWMVSTISTTDAEKLVFKEYINCRNK